MNKSAKIHILALAGIALTATATLFVLPALKHLSWTKPFSFSGFTQTTAAESNPAAFKNLVLAQDNIHVRFENRDLSLRLPIYHDVNRYYLPITEILQTMGGTQTLEANTLSLSLNGMPKILNLLDNTYSQGGQFVPLKNKALVKEDIVYLSLFDMHKLFDLKIDWDVPQKTLSLYYDRDKLERLAPATTGKPALIRLEDISATRFYTLPRSLEKLRIVADYLYQQHVPFHVAWVPRYIDPRPANKIDVDISEQYSMDNANFVYTLDYMLDRDGLIGLHGYTHQYGNSESISGLEFHTPYAAGQEIPATDAYALERINAAKKAAAKLEIPYSFFEAPHYAMYGSQLKVAENNFDYIYEHYPGAPNQITVKKNAGRTTKYIPTPLDYVVGKKDTDRMLQKIRSLKPGVLASFFYHPYIDFDSITLAKEADGYPTYTYAPDSVLHRLLKAFREQGYRFEKITDLKT